MPRSLKQVWFHWFGVDSRSQYFKKSLRWFLGSFPGCFDGKESACNAKDPGLSPRSRRSPGEGNDNSFQDSCLENSMERIYPSNTTLLIYCWFIMFLITMFENMGPFTFLFFNIVCLFVVLEIPYEVVNWIFHFWQKRLLKSFDRYLINP